MGYTGIAAAGKTYIGTGSTSPTFASIGTSSGLSGMIVGNGASAFTAVALGNNGILVTSASGVPSILAGPGTTGNILQSNAAAAPSFSIATYPSTAGSASNVLTSDGTNFVSTAPGGTSVITWSDKAVSFNAAAGNGYFVTAAATATLPASPTQGQTISFIADSATPSVITIQANTGQFIRLSTSLSASAGTAVNVARGDAITLVYRASDTTWIANADIGSWTIT